MLKKLKSTNQGFTIIEVLIVLAIAALILLIIFFAVPALQRNNRNTQLRNDASVILGFVNDFSANNNGSIPGGTTAICINTANGKVGMVASGPCDPATNNVGKIRAGTAINIVTATPATPAQGQLYVAVGFKCDGNAIATAATLRATAVFYLTETPGTDKPNCVES